MPIRWIVAAAALLIVSEVGDQQIDKDLDAAARRAGQAAMGGLSR